MSPSSLVGSDIDLAIGYEEAREEKRAAIGRVEEVVCMDAQIKCFVCGEWMIKDGDQGRWAWTAGREAGS